MLPDAILQEIMGVPLGTSQTKMVVREGVTLTNRMQIPQRLSGEEPMDWSQKGDGTSEQHQVSYGRQPERERLGGVEETKGAEPWKGLVWYAPCVICTAEPCTPCDTVCAPKLGTLWDAHTRALNPRFYIHVVVDFV